MILNTSEALFFLNLTFPIAFCFQSDYFYILYLYLI